MGGRGAIDRAIEAASEALTLAELSDEFIPLVEQELGAAGSLLFEFGDSGEPRGVSGSLAPHIAGYNATVFGVDPIQSAMRRRAPRTPTVELEDVLSFDELRASPAFHEFYRPLGLERLIAATPTEQRFGEPGMVGLMLGRPRTEAPFSAGERRALARVIPAMRALIARDRRLRSRERERAYTAAVLRELGHPAVVLDRRGTIAWWSPRADELLDADPRLGRALRDAVRSARAGEIELPTGHAAKLRRVRLADGSAVVIAELRDARAAGDTVLAAARQAQLTRAETSVLACVARGLDNRSIAAELHVSEATVKTHLRGILGKLGVTNRTQAALRAHGLLPRA